MIGPPAPIETLFKLDLARFLHNPVIKEVAGKVLDVIPKAYFEIAFKPVIKNDLRIVIIMR